MGSSWPFDGWFDVDSFDFVFLFLTLPLCVCVCVEIHTELDQNMMPGFPPLCQITSANCVLRWK